MGTYRIAFIAQGGRLTGAKITTKGGLALTPIFYEYKSVDSTESYHLWL